MQNNESPTVDVQVVDKPRIGRPKGAKNKPKRGRPKGTKSKTKAITALPPQRYDKPLKNWQKYLVRVSDKIDENKPILMIGEHLLVSAGAIVTFSGKPKSYKTFFTSAIVGAFLMGEYMNITSRNTDPQAKVLICDTEQGRARTQIVLRRIQAICGDDVYMINERVPTMSVREISANERTKTLFDAIYDIKPKLIIVDGIRDLIVDFNNIQESAEIVNLLMKAATELDSAIVVVIHLNKGDDNIRGHLGSELCNKSETVIKLKSETNGTVTVSPLHCRDVEFDEFAFRISDEGLPVSCILAPKSKEDKAEVKIRELKELFELAFKDSDAISRKELIDTIVSITKQSPKTATRRIDEGVEVEILNQLPNSTYIIANN